MRFEFMNASFVVTSARGGTDFRLLLRIVAFGDGVKVDPLKPKIADGGPRHWPIMGAPEAADVCKVRVFSPETYQPPQRGCLA
jgi:hypothetical protein